MAFCSKCGAPINDGAKFCPKCGQPTNVASHQQVNQSQQVDTSFGEIFKRFNNSKWNWVAACVLVIIFIGVKTCDVDVTDPVDVYNKVATAATDMEEKGYEDGYELAFSSGNPDYYIKSKEALEGYVRECYSSSFGAPSSSEEKELFNTYLTSFKKGFREGMNSR